jgi:hypothetical protein
MTLTYINAYFIKFVSIYILSRVMPILVECYTNESIFPIIDYLVCVYIYFPCVQHLFE